MRISFLNTLSALLLLTFSAGAQEAAPLLAESPADVPAPLGEASTPVAGNDGSPKKLDLLARSKSIIEKIRVNNRSMDPFGMAMDPTNMVESIGLADQYQDVEETPVITNSALKNALQTLPVTGIYPTKHTIVLGARTFKAGDVFGMKLEELTIRLRFEGVRGESIYFKDLDTQETASVEFNTRPAEFEPITSSSSAPMGKGIVPMDKLYIVN